ncbi:MAG: CARDB domain-containing protein [Saprospiraceae bacterium]|nr:hypothetical protein [Lewinella sp.]
MKTSCLITLFLLTAYFSFGQRTQATTKPQLQKASQATNTTVIQNSNYLKLMAPDLLPQAPVSLNSNGKRYIKAITINQGKLSSKSCYLTVIYRWKVDYENFTKKEIVKQYTIQPLDPNHGTSVTFEVPDAQIYSNKTFGSKNVSIQMTVDGTDLVIESDEQNNTKYLSLPILNH